MLRFFFPKVKHCTGNMLDLELALFGGGYAASFSSDRGRLLPLLRVTSLFKSESRSVEKENLKLILQGPLVSALSGASTDSLTNKNLSKT